MKKLVLPATFLSFLLCANALAEPPREASDILKEFDEVKMPVVDATKTQDPAWVRSYIDERTKAAEKQNRLALELYEAHPDHPQAIRLMLARWTNTTSGREAARSLSEMEAFLKDHPDSKDRPEVLYRRAVALGNTAFSDPQRVADAANEFIEARPKDERGASLLTRVAMMNRGKDASISIYRRIVADYPGTRAAATATGHIRRFDEIGKSFDLSFDEAISGQTISMKGLQGKVVVIDFWATWCGPCVVEMPKMKELYAKYKGQGVEFIGVSLDQPGAGLDKLKKFVEEKEIAWPQYYMGKGWESEFSQGWGINSIPSVFIVDANGNLYSTEARGKLETLIPELIKKRDEKS